MQYYKKMVDNQFYSTKYFILRYAINGEVKRERVHERTEARVHERTDGGADGRTIENTGLHPVLTYCAPSGLGGSMRIRAFRYGYANYRHSQLERRTFLIGTIRAFVAKFLAFVPAATRTI
jgi:hypothetical protein